MKVIYKGDHAGVVVPVNATTNVDAKWGDPVEVPDALGASLLESAAWMKAGKEIKKAAEPEAVANNKHNDGEE